MVIFRVYLRRGDYRIWMDDTLLIPLLTLFRTDIKRRPSTASPTPQSWR